MCPLGSTLRGLPFHSCCVSGLDTLLSPSHSALALTAWRVQAADVLGYTGCTAAVILMASPLAVLKNVVETKSTANLPFIPTCMIIANASTWTGYGALVVHNPIIWFPNALGLCAGLTQMACFAKYGMPPPAPVAAEAAEREDERDPDVLARRADRGDRGGHWGGGSSAAFIIHGKVA